MKTIIIRDDGSVEVSEPLTDNEKLALVGKFFDKEVDNEDQILFHIGILNCDHKETYTSDRSEQACIECGLILER